MRLCLGQAAGQFGDPAAALEHFTAVRDALEDTRRPASPGGPVMLSICLDGRSATLLAMGRVDEAADDGRRALDLAREAGIPGLEALALACLSGAAWHGGDRDGALRLARQAQQIPGEIAGALRRALSQIVTMVLTEAGDLAAAEQACTAALASCRDVGDLTNLGVQLWSRAILSLRTGRIDDATAHLREQLADRHADRAAADAARRPGLLRSSVRGHPAPGRGGHGVGRDVRTHWPVATPAVVPESGRAGGAPAKGPATARAGRDAGGRGARRGHEPGHGHRVRPHGSPRLSRSRPKRWRPDAADGAAAMPPGLARLSPREQELVTLVAQGRTDAQIAAQLYITVRTVSSHLDRIRDKTGCRRRADLTRLALSAAWSDPPPLV